MGIFERTAQRNWAYARVARDRDALAAQNFRDRGNQVLGFFEEKTCGASCGREKIRVGGCYHLPHDVNKLSRWRNRPVP